MRQRYQLYKAKAYGPRGTNPARMRELERVSEEAGGLLRPPQSGTRADTPTVEDRPQPLVVPDDTRSHAADGSPQLRPTHPPRSRREAATLVAFSPCPGCAAPAAAQR